ncbi:beta propeller repeat protein [Plantactinospora endophytica]|uniref:Exo-alpha-sialidase n=1 Tax=Plantactinospora endophytica TaxID=673535 RepID=A0ABQ4DUI2_9ACTN|nr:hypothetical protein [Plantactinospora endophytica]GIG86121.1 hypothetical protein Pen02_10570 [Plantactinospora endophytica]
MTELRELFEDATSAPPPTRLLADEVYAAGRRRLRRRRTAMSGTAFAVTACAVATAALAAVPGTAPGPAPVDERVAATAAPTDRPGVLPYPGRIQWMRAADSRHLYLALSTCPGGPCKTDWQLVGSDDGGRTWTERGTPGWYATALVLGPELLLVDRPTQPPGGGEWRLAASRDGGRSWQPTGTGPAVAALAAGSFAVCRPAPERPPVIPGGEPCRLHAFDPATNRVSPLAKQPPQTLIDRQVVEESADRLWVSGYDRNTRRPVIATSTDRGRSWSSHNFAEMSECGADDCPLVQLSVGPGGVDYAVITDARSRTVYRHSATEGWQRRPGAGEIPSGWSDPGSFVTPDGSHVMYEASAGSPGPGSGDYRFRAARRTGTSYQPVELHGLPAMFSPVLRARDGWLYARGDGDVSYGSADGWNWVPLNRR